MELVAHRSLSFVIFSLNYPAALPASPAETVLGATRAGVAGLIERFQFNGDRGDAQQTDRRPIGAGRRDRGRR